MHHGFPQGYFYIRSHTGKVLDVAGASTNSGAHVVAWTKKHHDAGNQLWHVDEGFLINKHSGFVLDIESGKLERDRRICQYEKKWIQEANNQRWGYQDGFIYCLAEPELVLDIRGGSEEDGAEIIVWDRKHNDNANQKWVLEQVDH
ncbi:ricin B lectin domain-containing protein [Jimgerdemannia flammicorona]|uniref:Ricin B lectin domain-containing protein n=2 Tax=Jimgerdemannia flammicorona TaxID=994334 RepID=A0A433QD53_9FUNG|nr:ricin B lectin domain-containing protein [Jimgerdemannia flammicorona]RUS27723.1 ricin B lectin domain-containing protein [Jimgerdemannia flammicorona]